MTKNTGKCDEALGRRVEAHLQELGLETVVAAMDPAKAIAEVEVGIALGLKHLGLDPADESTRDTPRRYAEMLVEDLTWGLDYTNFPKCTAVSNKLAPRHSNLIPGKMYDEMVLMTGITVMSLCEHHLQTIDGVMHIAYIPRDKVIGLSKLARIATFFARRPQVQERLTEQVYQTLRFILETDDVAVVCDAAHYCMKARGAEQSGTSTTTNRFGGAFREKDNTARQEFFHAVSNATRR